MGEMKSRLDLPKQSLQPPSSPFSNQLGMIALIVSTLKTRGDLETAWELNYSA